MDHVFIKMLKQFQYPESKEKQFFNVYNQTKEIFKYFLDKLG